jgi:hypothetical protein
MARKKSTAKQSIPVESVKHTDRSTASNLPTCFPLWQRLTQQANQKWTAFAARGCANKLPPER